MQKNNLRDMFVYFLVFIVALLYYLVGSHQSKKLLILFMSYIAIFIGLGDMIGGYDRYIYGAIFDDIVNQMIGGYTDIEIFNNSPYRGTEFGYVVWNIIVAHISSNRYMFIFLTTIVMYVLYIKSFLEYFEKYPILCILFLGLFFYFTITYMRQCFSVAVAWQGIKYIWERKPLPFFLITLIAFSIHNSALIFFVFYFVPLKKYTRQQIIVFMVLCFLLGWTPLAQFLIVSSDEYTGSVSRNYANEMHGYNMMYLLEVLLFLFILLRYYHLLPSDRKTLVFLNLFLGFSSILLVFSRFVQGGRIGWFFLIGLFYIFSYFFYHYNVKKIIRVGMIVVSFLLFARITTGWAFNLTPYTTFLTNGYPSGVREIYEENEWDERYTVNKFYRPMIEFK